MPQTSFLYCLTIDLAQAPLELRVALSLQPDEIRDLLCHAGSEGAPLLVLSTSTSLTMISTTEYHRRAFRPVLAQVLRHASSADGWQKLTVRIGSGSDAGRLLLSQAIPCMEIEPEIRAFVCSLRAAAKLSVSCAAFSAELASLVRVTEHAAERLWNETSLGRADASSAAIELDHPAAERIVEEELVAWQSSAPRLRASQRPLSDPDLFGVEKHRSMLQLRSSGVLTKLRKLRMA